MDTIIEEIINNKNFEKSHTEVETFVKKEEIIYPQENENNSNIILDNLNEKKINNDKIQAMFKRGRHNLSIFFFIISQDYFELPNRTIRAKENIYHIFKPNNFRDVLNIYQDKSSMDMTLNKFNLLTSTCWKEKYQPLTIDMTRDKYTG